MYMIRYFGILVFLIAGLSGVSSQTILEVDEVQVIKDFEARLKDFRKVKMEPVLPVFDMTERKYEYRISSKPLSLEYDKPSIRPLALPDLPGMSIKRGGLELGYGIPNAIKGAFYYGATREEFSSALGIRHHSANNKQIENQKYSHNAIEFTLSNTFDNDVYYDGMAFVNVDYINLYGVEANKDTLFDYTNPQRRLIHMDISNTFQKTEIADNLDAAFSLDYRLLHNNMEALAENDFHLGAKIDYIASESFRFFLPINADIALNEVAGTKTVFGFNPGFRFKQPYFNIELGGEFVYADQWNIFPEIQVNLSKLWGYFDVFAGVTQEAFLNDSYYKINLNPFFRMAGDTVPLTVEQGYFGGVRGDIEGAKFEASVNYTTTTNAELFVPSIIDKRQFDVVYDTLTDFFIEGSLSYEITRNITFAGALTKHFYSVTTELKPWHRPDWDADFTARFSFFRNKLLVDGSLFFMSGLHTPATDSGQPERLPVIFDISGKAQYALFPNFSVFAQWNNITATKYNRWYQYPSYRINLIGGIKMKF